MVGANGGVFMTIVDLAPRVSRLGRKRRRRFARPRPLAQLAAMRPRRFTLASETSS